MLRDSGLGPRPAQRMLLAYLVAIAAGTALLCTPLASAAPGRTAGVIDGIFTATSAISVTGLTVLDTGRDFSPFGQAVILALIQLGGLGVMTFSTFLLLGMGGRASMAAREATGDPLGAGSGRRLWPTLKAVFILTAALELSGAVVLYLTWTFSPGPAGPGPAGLGPLGRAWAALFHSVAAFCNAGFSTFDGNLMGYRGSPLTNAVVALLIVAGGLGFVSLTELVSFLRPPKGPGARWRLSSHTRLVLTVTALLIVAGAAGIYALERDNTLAGLPPGQRVMASLFHSITARTAGFNTLPVGRMLTPTLFLIVMLMFVGASPCSAGGGIKTTTLGVLITTALARLRGRTYAECFDRTVPRETAIRSATLTILAAVIVIGFLFALLATEPAGRGAGGFMKMAFEAVSAFGTVGLSTGITPELTPHGKLLLSALMLAGKVGPLSLMVAFSRPSRQQLVRGPEAEVMVG
jgi:trk system potassium uptake protein TrkH